MIEHSYDCVGDALVGGLRMLLDSGLRRESRNGAVLTVPYPVVTVMEQPAKRVLFSPARDANPFFHLVEALWMLAGRDDVELVAKYVKRMREFSDDGIRLGGAYGYRWRRHFGIDQLPIIVNNLKRSRDDRRQVLQMWGAQPDLWSQATKKDVCCNLTATLQCNILTGGLDMVILQRSGDALWGVHGANAVHFSMLLEYLATLIGVPMGTMTQITVNYHLYEKMVPQAERIVAEYADQLNLSGRYPAATLVIMDQQSPSQSRWDEDCRSLLNGELSKMSGREGWLCEVALPMIAAHEAYRQGNPLVALNILSAIPDGILGRCDWRVAGEDWINRRITKETDR